MILGKVTRWLLASAAAIVIIWSFGKVGHRLWEEYNPTDHRTQLTILQWGDASEENVVRTLVARYEQEHPDIKILRIHAAQYDEKLKTMLSAGTPPDLFYLSYDSIPEYQKYHLLTDLDPFIEKMPDGQAWLGKFYPLLVDAFRYDGHQSGRGPLYGVPKDFTTLVMFVNTDLFAKAGLAVPYGGWTWDEFEEDCKKISALSSSKDATGRTYGAVLNTSWPAVLQNIIQTFGGDLFNGSDFRDVTLGSPESIAAMTMVQRVRFIDNTVYHATGPSEKDNGYQLFFTGKVGCLGPVGRWETPHFRGTGPGDPGISEFNWDIVPLPHEKKTVSDIAVVAWTMSSATKHPKESFDLLQFLCGEEGQEMTGKLGLAVPSMKAVANSPAFLQGKPDHSQLFLDELQHSTISQLPSEPEFAQFLDDEVAGSLELNQESPADAAARVKERWLGLIDSPLVSQEFPAVNWRLIGGISAGVLLVLLAILGWVSRREKLGSLDKRIERTGWLFISPWVVGFVLLTLGPMVMSLLLSMTRWTALTPVTDAQFVGAANFNQLFRFDADFVRSLQVTKSYALLMIPLGQIAALCVALLMNTKVRGIVAFRTIYYIPTLVGGVTMATIWLWLFDRDYGLINRMLMPVCAFFGKTPPDWVGQDAMRWGVPAFVLMSLWTVGGGMLTYLAALKNVPVSLYEAAHIDGAGKIRQFFAVTLPMISPLVLFNLIIAIIASFQVFAQVYVMTGGGPKNATLFYVLYLYRQAFTFHNMGYASALAWILFVIVLVLTGIVMGTSRLWVYYEGLKS